MQARRLSALESAFVALESRDVPFVFACILEFDRPVSLEVLRARVASALGEGSRFRQRIVGRDWVDDDAFDIARHVDVATVPPPGGPHELDRLAGRLLATELPHEHPPWRMWTVVGGWGGAVIVLVHHALVDGISGVEALEQLLGGATTLGTSPVPRAKLDVLRRLASRDNARALARLLRDGLNPADRIGLNPRHTSNDRIVTSHTFDLDLVRRIERTFGVTINDVALATVAGALHRFLERRGFDPTRLHDVRAMIPVARYARGEHASAGNKVTLLLAPLPVRADDPVDRLLSVAAATRHLKHGHTAAGGDLLVALGEATTPAVLAGVLRLALRMRAFNVLVTNIPGPKTKLALDGAELTRIVPIVNLWPHQALGIAVASYAGALTFGLQADRHVIPELEPLRDDLVAAFDALAARALT